MTKEEFFQKTNEILVEIKSKEESLKRIRDEIDSLKDQIPKLTTQYARANNPYKHQEKVIVVTPATDKDGEKRRYAMVSGLTVVAGEVIPAIRKINKGDVMSRHKDRVKVEIGEYVVKLTPENLEELSKNELNDDSYRL